MSGIRLPGIEVGVYEDISMAEHVTIVVVRRHLWLFLVGQRGNKRM